MAQLKNEREREREREREDFDSLVRIIIKISCMLVVGLSQAAQSSGSTIKVAAIGANSRCYIKDNISLLTLQTEL